MIDGEGEPVRDEVCEEGEFVEERVEASIDVVEDWVGGFRLVTETGTPAGAGETVAAPFVDGTK